MAKSAWREPLSLLLGETINELIVNLGSLSRLVESGGFSWDRGSSGIPKSRLSRRCITGGLTVLVNEIIGVSALG